MSGLLADAMAKEAQMVIRRLPEEAGSRSGIG